MSGEKKNPLEVLGELHTKTKGIADTVTKAIEAKAKAGFFSANTEAAVKNQRLLQNVVAEVEKVQAQVLAPEAPADAASVTEQRATNNSNGK